MPVIWFTGISGSGKTTLSAMLHQQMRRRELPVRLLDGDQVRKFFENDLGYTRQERIFNISRIAFAARELSDCGIAVVVANIAPYYEVRDFLRRKLPNYIQVYLKSSLQMVRDRDVQGHYLKNSRGEMTNLIGVDDVYDVPRNPDLILETGTETAEESFAKLALFLTRKGILTP